MNIYEATQNGLGRITPWYFGIKSYVSNNGETVISVEHGYEGDTELIETTVNGEYQFIEDVENALLNHDVFEFATGPIHGGGFPPKK